MRRLHNNSKSISANEVNKFLYCPYQWYYERLYGSAEIRELYKERNERLGLHDIAYSNFKKGQAYHAEFESAAQAGRGFKWFVRIAVIVMIIAGIVCGYLFYRCFLY